MSIKQQRASWAITILVLILAATASMGTLTTWPTDGSVEVTGNYGMTERGGSGDWIHHSEIDVNGKPDTTIVRAVKDGWICYIDIEGTATDDSILGLEIACLADTLYYSYHHIRPLDPGDPAYVDIKGVRYDSVPTWIAVNEGQALGYVKSMDDTLNTVSHPHVAFAASYLLAHDETLVQHTRNPLIEYSNLDPAASDGDDLPDIHQIMFHRVPDLPGQQFFPDSIPIYGPVDIVAEITDDQGHIPYQGTLEHTGRTYFRGITSVPLTAGYWIDGPTTDVLDPGS